MPRKALRCCVELNIHAVTCPGVWLPRRDDLYLSVTLFGETRRTILSGPVFPLVFHERFRFDKIFYTAFNPGQVADSLEDHDIIIELIQVSNVLNPGRVLAYYEANVKDFLYPYPTFSVTYGIQDRDLLMERSLEFPGISPKLEFSSKTTIKETSVPVLSQDDIDLYDIPISSRTPRYTTRRSRSRSRSRCRSASRSRSYGRPTISSIFRSRSISPIGRRFENLDLCGASDEDIKPPFVVRKVGKDLIGRTPGTDSSKKVKKSKKKRKLRTRSRSASWIRTSPLSSSHSLTNDYYDYLGAYQRARKALKEPVLNGYDDIDSEILELTGGTDYPRYYSAARRSPSPLLYRSSLRDRFPVERPLSALSSVNARVERALSRNRSPIRVDPVYTPRSTIRSYDDSALTPRFPYYSDDYTYKLPRRELNSTLLASYRDMYKTGTRLW